MSGLVIRDVRGRTFDADRPFRRIVSLVPAITESFFDLGLASHLVGRSEECLYPAGRVASVPTVGKKQAPDLTRIRALAPDLVIASPTENRLPDLRRLEAMGLPVFLVHPRGVHETLTMLWDLATLTGGIAEAGPRIQALERACDWTQAASQARPPVPVFVPIQRDPWMTFSAGTYAHELLALCGGENVFGDWGEISPDSRQPRHTFPITLDEMASLAPEVILLPSGCYPFGEEDKAAFANYTEVPAVRSHRIHLIDGSLLFWAGTRLAKALTELPPRLGPSPGFPDDPP